MQPKTSSKNHNYVLIMAGGAGTRLWPISRQERPKQFQAFTSDQTLLQHMVDLSRQVVPVEQIFIMAIPEFSEVIRQQIPDITEENLLFEPSRRDTGPAITLGITQVHERDPQAVVAVLWSDHHIQKPAVFKETLEAAFQTVKTHPKTIVMAGAKPTHPDTGLGYIQMGKEFGQYNDVTIFRVKRFVEKPDLPTATEFVSSWEYLWNMGYEIMRAENFLKTFQEVQPDLAPVIKKLSEAAAKKDYKAIGKLYEKFPKISIEFLFTQHLQDLLVVPADIGWSDVGNWNTLHDVLKYEDLKYLVKRGKVLAVETENSLIFAKHRPIATVGVKDLIVVDDGDVILIMHKDAAQKIKTLTKELETYNQDLL